MIKPPDNLRDALTVLHTSLIQMERWGCRGFDLSPEILSRLDHWNKQEETHTDTSGNAEPVEALAAQDAESLDDIRGDLGDCRRCALANGRKHIVFGEGNPKARLVFVGEGPGGEEDLQGKPFVGAAGQLLTKIIAAMKFSRGDVYICNVVKCRPPSNRNPQSDEIAACRPFLERQLAAIDPEVICTLGTFASQTLLDTDQPISRLRGRFHPYKKAKVMPTFHPAYLLRNPDQKRAVWEDMKKILQLLRIPL